MPAVVRVFEAATQRETTKTANCSEGEVGGKTCCAFWKSVSFNELYSRLFLARTPKRLFFLLNTETFFVVLRPHSLFPGASRPNAYRRNSYS